jgi:hypothetical protein
LYKAQVTVDQTKMCGIGTAPRLSPTLNDLVGTGNVMTTLGDAIRNVSSFLAVSADTSSRPSLLRRLSDQIPETWPSPNESTSREFRVVCYSLDLLETLHRATKGKNGQLGVKDWRLVNALVDLIIVLGLYRVLSPGVGPPESLRKKSLLLAKDAQNIRYPVEERKPLEQRIISMLISIIDDGGEIGDSLQRKNFVDILGGILDLAYNPEYPQPDRARWKSQYEQIVASKYVSITIDLTQTFSGVCVE